jgi:nitrate/TMAO reductase-like tetraheme cytochrome c subunit
MKRFATILLVAAVSVSAAADNENKNLQVLPKTTAREQIKKIMKAQNKALGVECDYCHDVPDMASDAKEQKKIAREMMRMTIELNEKYFTVLRGGKPHTSPRVACVTCHRGETEPAQ